MVSVQSSEITAKLRNLVQALDRQAELTRHVEEAVLTFDTHLLATAKFEHAQGAWNVARARYAVDRAELEAEDELIPGAHLEPDLVREEEW